MTDLLTIPEEEKELNQLAWAKFRNNFYECRGHITPAEQDVFHEELSAWQRSVLNQFKLCFEAVPDELTEEELQEQMLKDIS